MPKENTIIGFLNENAKRDAVSFHMPGHKGRKELFEKYGYADLMNDVIKYDITEIPGADTLFDPATIIKNVMDNYAELYGARYSELLVNGSSAGIMAAVLSSVPIGGKLILGRNSHHSAFSALRLGGINPVYIQPETDPFYSLSAEISPYALEDACKANPDASAILITSPNYCGILSDIALLADIAGEYGMTLIVDQAHGAHLKFFDNDAKALRESGAFVPHLYHSAESLGADIVINSTHKTLLSFTGSSILNVMSDRVNTAYLAELLRMLQTTSPSYLLMASLDINERIMREHGREIVNEWKENLEFFYRNAAKINGLTVVRGSNERRPGARDEDCFPMYRYREGPDITKINISMAGLGLSGERLARELRYKGIVSEMIHGEYLLLMTGAGNIRSDYELLLEALSDISSSYGISEKKDVSPRSFEMPPAEAADVPSEFEAIPLYQSEGRVLYDPIISYPPGSPIICPGEIMSLETISRISDLLANGDAITGVDEEGLIKVGRR